MSDWTWDEIDTDWLIGSKLALPPDEIVAAFNTVERHFGRDWMEASRTHSGAPVRGTHPTLSIVTDGQILASLEGVKGAEQAIERMRQGYESAWAELAAIHLIRAGEPKAIVEVDPVVQVGERQRKPDFRMRLPNDELWTYVEVTQPEIAEAQTKAEGLLTRLADLVQSIRRTFALEVFLRREPTESEITDIAGLIPQFCLSQEAASKDLPGLAILSLNPSLPGRVVPLDHPGEPNVPRLGTARVMWGPEEPHRHISVRMAFADDRAEAFLRKEAKQLPADSPGFIMVQMSRAPGGIKTWEPVLKRRFQPNLYTRVSAVCLWQGGHELMPDGEAWLPHAKVISNPHAPRHLASWIVNALSKSAPMHSPPPVPNA